MTPDQYCRDRTGGALSDVFFSVLFAPAPARRAVTALRALEREIADVPVQCSEPEVADATLRWWREEIEAMYQGRPRHPVTRALAPHLRRCKLPADYFLQLAAGAAEDARRARFARFADLSVHIVHTAGAVAMLEAVALGISDRGTARFAHFLAQGSELARLVRFLGQHARAGRLYLPREDLDAFGVRDADILRARTSDAVARLLAFEIERCAGLFHEALVHLAPADRRAQLPGLVRMALDLEVLAEIRREGCRVLEHRTELTPLRKLRIALRVRRRGWTAPATATAPRGQADD